MFASLHLRTAPLLAALLLAVGMGVAMPAPASAAVDQAKIDACMQKINPLATSYSQQTNTTPGSMAGSTGGPTPGTTDAIVQFANTLVRLLSMVIAPVTMGIGWVLSTPLLLHYLQDTGGFVHAFWVLVRNLTNYVLLASVIGMGFAMVVKGSTDGFGGKFELMAAKNLPRIAIAAVAVNFSLFFFRVLLDVSSVASTVVFSIPTEVTRSTLLTDEDKAAFSLQPSAVPDVCMDGNVQIAFPFYRNYTWDKNKQTMVPSDETGKPLQPSQMGDPKYGYSSFEEFMIAPGSVAFVLTYNVLEMSNMSYFGSGFDVRALANYSMQAIIAVIIFLIVAISLCTLFAVLLYRLVLLIVLIVISPIIVVLHVLDGVGLAEKAGVEKLFSIENIISLAFLPAIVGVPLSLAFIFGAALKQYAAGSGGVGGSGEPFSIPGMNFFLNDLQLGPIGSFGDLLAFVIVVGFLWVAVFACLGSNDFTKPIAEGVKSYTQEWVENKDMIPVPILKDFGVQVSDVLKGGLTGDTKMIGDMLKRQAEKMDEGAKDTLRGNAAVPSVIQNFNINGGSLRDTLRDATEVHREPTRTVGWLTGAGKQYANRAELVAAVNTAKADFGLDATGSGLTNDTGVSDADIGRVLAALAMPASNKAALQGVLKGLRINTGKLPGLSAADSTKLLKKASPGSSDAALAALNGTIRTVEDNVVNVNP